MTYEGYGPGGVAVYVEASTDNKNRSAAEIRHVFGKFGGNMGEVGCVGWMFHRKGEIQVPKASISEDQLMEIALEAGAEDIEAEGEVFIVRTDWQEMMAVRAAMEEKGVKVESANIAMIPGSTVKVEGKEGETLMKLLGALEDLDDVNNVSANYEMDDALLEKLAG